MTNETLKETALETICESCGSVTDELEPGPYGLYVCHECHVALPQALSAEYEEA